MGLDAMILVFWMLSFMLAFSLFSFTFIKRLFISSSLSIRVVSSVYLRLLIFLLAFVIPACASSSPAYYMMYSAYKLNKQSDNIQPWHPSCLCAKLLKLCPTHCEEPAWSLSKGFSRQEYWSGLSCPPPGHLPYPRMKPTSHVSCIGRQVLYH